MKVSLTSAFNNGPDRRVVIRAYGGVVGANVQLLHDMGFLDELKVSTYTNKNGSSNNRIQTIHDATPTDNFLRLEKYNRRLQELGVEVVIRRSGTASPESASAPMPGFRVYLTAEEQAEFEAQQAPRPKPVAPSQETKEGLGSRIHKPPESPAPMDRKPGENEVWKALKVIGGGFEVAGVFVTPGMFIQKGDEISRVTFEPAHMISQVEAGRPRWWNEDGTANWRPRPRVINEFESSFKWTEDRDQWVERRFVESGYKFLTEEQVGLMIVRGTARPIVLKLVA